MRKLFIQQLLLLLIMAGTVPLAHGFEDLACEASAGTLTAGKSTVQLHGKTKIAAHPNGDIHVPHGYATIYVLTSGEDLVIEQVANHPEFKVDMAGKYTIHTLVYNDDAHSPDFLDLGIVEFGKTTGGDVLGIVTSNGICASLDVAGAPIMVIGDSDCTASAGSLEPVEYNVTLEGEKVEISATRTSDAVVPDGYALLYVLTSWGKRYIEQVNTEPVFEVGKAKVYRIHTLVYDPRAGSDDFLDLSIVEFKRTQAQDVLDIVTANGICAALDFDGAKIRVETCEADAGTLTADESTVTFTDKAIISAHPNGDIHVPNGYSKIFVLTSGENLVIEQVSDHPEFTVEEEGLYTIHTLVFNGDAHDPNFLDLSIVEFGKTTGGDVLGIVTEAGICASLDVAGAPITVEKSSCLADAGTLTADEEHVEITEEGTLSATPNGDINIPDGYSSIFVLTSGDELVIEQVNSEPSFVVTKEGKYTIHTLVFDGNEGSENFLDLSIVEFGKTTGVDVLNVVTSAGICASLDVAGAPIMVTEKCLAEAGTLESDDTYVLLQDGKATLSATRTSDAVVPDGYALLYVLTSWGKRYIEQVNTEPVFEVDRAKVYRIHTLVYDPREDSDDFLDLSIVQFRRTLATDVLKIVEENGICAALDLEGAKRIRVEECEADAGTLAADADFVNLLGDEVEISASPNGDINVPKGYSKLFVLTSGEGLVIEQVGDKPTFSVSEGGLYTIHTLVYNGDAHSPNFLDLSIVEPGVTTGVDVLNLVADAGICASLDAAGAPVTVEKCEANAGTLTADVSFVNLFGAGATISATPNGDINVPDGYSSLFVLTSGEGLVIEQVGSEPSFEVSEGGLYTIHTLVYNGNSDSPNFLDLSIVEPGVTTGVDVLGLVTAAGLCASLDVAGAPITVEACEADAGTLTADASFVNLFGAGATISATPNGDINVPDGYSPLFVLTSGEGLVIEQVGSEPSFEVSEGGLYTIHTLVYNGNADSPNFLDLSIVEPGVTTGGDVLGLVTAAGLCASLDVAGAPITVEECVADAGTLTADAISVNFFGEPVSISATPNGDINVPDGYSSLFVLTSGEGLVIEQVGSEPSFEVSEAGLYTIHTLVYNGNSDSPNFLDLSIVEPGVTTGGDVLGLVTAAGLCASLDVAGAPITVEECVADAGTLTADASSVNFFGEPVSISATPNGDINVPDGYSSLFVLTSGEGLVIEQVGSEPSFEVSEAGLYTIHTLVYNGNSDSPNFLDLSIVEPGVTTGGDVLGLVTAAGLCASLDVAGAPIEVTGCQADAGTLTADASSVNLLGDAVTISATPNGDINVPDGYSSLFVLTSGEGLVIEQVGSEPSFEVSEAGLYTIHTLVYNGNADSPNFLDLSIVEPGVTTGVDVLGLVTAAGLCASLDVAGAPITVEECVADAGTLTAVSETVQIENGAATLEAVPNGDAFVPEGYAAAFVLTSGTDLIIEQIGFEPSFTVTENGLFTIHTIVFNPDPSNANFLDVSVVEFGVTPAAAVLGLVADAGLCVALDVAGAPINVEGCAAFAGTLTAIADSVILQDSVISISATPNGDINVPTDFSSIFVLTKGAELVIEQVGSEPTFSVDATGDYTIHTLVYDGNVDSPDYLDLGIVELGVTTGVDVLTLVTDLGLCASLDVAGAPINVAAPSSRLALDLNRTQNTILLKWNVSNSTKGNRYVVEKSLDGRLFTQLEEIEESENFVETKTYTFADPAPSQEGVLYRVRLLDKGGNEIDRKTAAVSNDMAELVNVSIYPNPSVDRLNIEYLDTRDENINIHIYNMQGQQMHQAQDAFEGTRRFTHSVVNYPEGLYRIVMVNAQGEIMNVGKFVKQ